jgi:hypothetical protein
LDGTNDIFRTYFNQASGRIAWAASFPEQIHCNLVAGIVLRRLLLLDKIDNSTKTIIFTSRSLNVACALIGCMSIVLVLLQRTTFDISINTYLSAPPPPFVPPDFLLPPASPCAFCLLFFPFFTPPDCIRVVSAFAMRIACLLAWSRAP